jgi:hypothetical protein
MDRSRTHGYWALTLGLTLLTASLVGCSSGGSSSSPESTAGSATTVTTDATAGTGGEALQVEMPKGKIPKSLQK